MKIYIRHDLYTGWEFHTEKHLSYYDAEIEVIEVDWKDYQKALKEVRRLEKKMMKLTDIKEIYY